MRKREDSIEIFENFRNGLELLITRDRELFEHDIRKETIAGRLAMYFSNLFSKEWYIDIATDGADLLVWDRKSTIALALFISRDYISQKGKDKAREYHLIHRPMLTLAFSILEDKDYILIYRFEELFLDYIHIFPELDFEEKVLKRVMIEEEHNDPLLFTISKRRRRKKIAKKEETVAAIAAEAEPEYKAETVSPAEETSTEPVSETPAEDNE